MKMLGIWPEERKFNKISSYVILISSSIMALFITIPQTINLFIIWGDLSMVVENLTLSNMTVAIALFKLTAFWWNGRSNYRSNYGTKLFYSFIYSALCRSKMIQLLYHCFLPNNCITEDLKILLSYIEEDRREAKTPEEVKRMMKIAKICRILSVAGIFLIILLLGSALCVRIWMNRFTGRMLILTIYSPYDYVTSPYYELTIASQLLAGVYSCTTYTVVDLFLATLMFHTCGQFETLKEKFHNLYSKSKYGSMAVVAEIVKKHHSLCEFVETVENLFTYMLLIQMLGCTILLCVQSFQAVVIITGQSIEMILPQMVFFVTYIAYILLQLFLYCFISEKLHSESMSMIDAAYQSKWYDLSPNEARALIIIMVRARTPLCLTAGKFCSLNHELFSSILKTSMSYLSVLYAMKINDAG